MGEASAAGTDGALMIWFGLAGLVANSVSLSLLMRGQRESLNVRGAFLEVASDALGSLAVMVSAAVILLTGWQAADPAASLAIALLTVPSGLVSSVGTVFVFAASALTPVLLLGVWWAGLTARGAVAGMVCGALSCGGALLASALVPDAGLVSAMLAQPAAWTIPLATLVVIAVSLLDRRRVPVRTERYLARLHLPER